MPFQRKHKSKKAGRILIAIALLLLLALVAMIIHHRRTPQSVTPLLPAYPSVSAKMICATKAQYEIAAVIGVNVTSVSMPSWSKASQIYSCTYLYANDAKITLSMKATSSTAETTAYFNYLAKIHGRAYPVTLGQGAFGTNNGSVVVRKNDKVLFIDVTQLPKLFGPSADPSAASYTRAGDATAIATTILNCWNGD